MQYEYLDINSVELDMDNPRIKQWVEIYGDNITSEGIALALGSSGDSTSSSYESLKESIKVNNGIINPILVNKLKDGRMIVIEGNTRLQIYKEFNAADPKGPWNKIIAIVYDNLEAENIHAIRLQSHLVGPRDWDAYSKAKYLNQLSNIDHMPINTIISFCGGKKAEVLKLIDAYVSMEKNYFPLAKELGLEPVIKEFSKYAEFENRNIKQAVYANKYTDKDFSSWVLNKNIDNAQNVRKLPAVLANEKAKSIFLKSNISEATKVLGTEDGSSHVNLDSVSMNILVNELLKRLRNIQWRDIKALKTPAKQEEKNDLLILNDEISSLLSEIGAFEDE